VRADRKEIRALLRKVFVRSNDAETKEGIRKAPHVFADEADADA
jgi:hypothetical protein